jgi:hypothetical protein
MPIVQKVPMIPYINNTSIGNTNNKAYIDKNK